MTALTCAAFRLRHYNYTLNGVQKRLTRQSSFCVTFLQQQQCNVCECMRRTPKWVDANPKALARWTRAPWRWHFDRLVCNPACASKQQHCHTTFYLQESDEVNWGMSQIVFLANKCLSLLCKTLYRCICSESLTILWDLKWKVFNK